MPAFALVDAPYLRPVPAASFVFAERKKATANIDYHVEYAGIDYGVPQALIHQVLELRITRSTIEVLAKAKWVGGQPRSARKVHYETLTKHRPASHRAHAECSPGTFRRIAHTSAAGSAKAPLQGASSKRF